MMNNEDLVKKMVKEVWNAHKPNEVQNFFDQNIVVHGSHGEIKGIEKLSNFVKEICTAFPDLEYSIQDIFSTQNKVVVRWVGKGTHKGNFIGNSPTNKNMSYEGISIYNIQNEKIKECWITADLFGILKQLNILHAASH